MDDQTEWYIDDRNSALNMKKQSNAYIAKIHIFVLVLELPEGNTTKFRKIFKYGEK